MRLSPISVVKPMDVDPSVNLTQPLRELTLPENCCPRLAPSTYHFVAPGRRTLETDADVRPLANLILVCSDASAAAASNITKQNTLARNFPNFIPMSSSKNY